MTRRYVRRLVVAAAIVAGLASCAEDITDPPEWYSQAVADAWQFLDWFFVFRERLPADPYEFVSPVSMYRAVNERFTRYYTNEEARYVFAQLSSSSVGMGVLLDSVAPGLLVKQVCPDSPAELAGVHKRDTILSIDDSLCAGRPFGVALSWIAGQQDDRRALWLRGEAGERTVVVTLGPYTAPTVFVDTVDTAVAYIALSGFLNQTTVAGGSASEFSGALYATLWADYTILDLRGNGGGYVDQCLRICGEFVPLGTSAIRATERELRGTAQGGDTVWTAVTVDTVWRTETSGIAQSRRCYVLVDTNTASASEVLVSCLRDWRSSDTRTVGIRTFGKGRGQYLIGYDDEADEYFLSDGGVARVTFSVLNPVLGEPYDSIGITPDVVVGPGEDALEVAIGLIRGSVPKTTADAAACHARVASINRLAGQLRSHAAPPALIGAHPRTRY